jgi:predicted PurR-regulated permease PerM
MASRLKARSAVADDARSSAKASADVREPLPLHPGGRLVARAALAIALVAIALWTAADFLPALIWAAILAITAWPLYVPFASAVSRGPSAGAPLLFTLLVGATIFLPIMLASYQIAQQSDVLFSWIAQSRDNGIKVPDWIVRLPIAADAIERWWRENLTNPQAAAGWFQGLNADKAADVVKTFGGQLLHRTFMFFVSLIALYVFLRNGQLIARRCLDTADRIFGDPGEGLTAKMVEAIRGTVNGTIVVALAEGLLIGVAYLIAGVPNPVLFTILTISFAMLPFGAWAAFTVAAATLLIGGGNVWAAFGVFAWGSLVMLTGDHFVWPTLVGGAARLPFLLAFIGIFGGLASFGLLGLFLGPVVMAALVTVWREWVNPDEARHGHENARAAQREGAAS